MSRRQQQFKALLRAEQETGSSQKMRLLQEEELLPPALRETPDNEIDNNHEDSNSTSDGSTNAVSVVKQEVQSQNQDSSNPSELNHSTTGPITDKSNGSSESDIKSIISTLADSDDQNVDETHTRRTYLIENELLEELERVSNGKKKGYKTKIINAGLRIVLDLMKQNKHGF